MSEAEEKAYGIDWSKILTPDLIDVVGEDVANLVINNHTTLDRTFNAVNVVDDMIREEVQKSSSLKFYLRFRMILMRSIEDRINERLGDRGAAFQFTQSGINIAANPQWLLQEIAGDSE